MIRIKVPDSLYRVALTRECQDSYLRGKQLTEAEAELEFKFHTNVKFWFYENIGYVPKFIAPTEPYIILPTKDTATVFKMRWY